MKMEQLIEITENKIDRFIEQLFNKDIKPVIVKAMKKAGIKRIQECNNAIFFDMLNGEKSIIDSKFNDEQEQFAQKYIYPLRGKYTTLNRIVIDITV